MSDAGAKRGKRPLGVDLDGGLAFPARTAIAANGRNVPRSTPLHLRCGVGTTWEWTVWAVNGTDHFLQIMLIENIALAAFKSRVALRFLSCVLGPGRRQIILNAI
jgi:hypothetical protein